MARKKKGGAGAQPAPSPNPPAAHSLTDEALAHFGIARANVLLVREIRPGVVRIITRNAHKFTYTPPAAPSVSPPAQRGEPEGGGQKE